MKLVAEYLDRALQFERMADAAEDPHKLATKRALQLGLPAPDQSNPS